MRRCAKEAIVVGAHYDHLGLGGRHSLAPDATGQVHNGADDNASGIAGLLEIARAASLAPVKPPRTLVFVAFAGEELGLLGSAWYVDHPVVPLEQTAAMVNLDMIGRPDGRILVSGVESAPSLDADLKAASQHRTIALKSFREGAGVGSSDDTSFLLRKVPVVSFFSGFHADYHRPSDDSDKIEAAGATEVTRIALALVQRIAARPSGPSSSSRPCSTACPRRARAAGTVPTSARCPTSVTRPTAYGSPTCATAARLIRLACGEATC